MGTRKPARREMGSMTVNTRRGIGARVEAMFDGFPACFERMNGSNVSQGERLRVDDDH